MNIEQLSGRGICVPLLSLVALVAFQGCSAAVDSDQSESLEQISQAAAVADPVPCSAWADAIDANTSNVTIGAGTLTDSYQSSLGAYGGTNVGSAAIVQAATTISNNGGVVHGTLKPRTPGNFAVVPVPAGAKNLPLGARTPGSLGIGSASESITLAPGNYVATNISISTPGAITVSPPGQVRIWVTGQLSLGGNLNQGGVPKNLAFLVTSSGWVNINGGNIYGLVYAPTSGMFVSGSVFGTVIGKSVTLNSGGALHFDKSSVCPAN
jgi:hypothetical protein